MCHIRGTTCPTLKGRRREDFFERGCIRNRNVSNPRGSATRGFFLNAVASATATCPTLEGWRRVEVFVMCHIRGTTCPTLKGRLREEIYLEATSFATATCSYRLNSSSFSLRAFQVKSSQIKPSHN